MNIQAYEEKTNPVGLLLSVLLFGLYPLHFVLEFGGGSVGGVNLSYGDIVVVFIGLLWFIGLFKSRNLPRYLAFLSVFVAVAGISFTFNAFTPAAYYDTTAFLIALVKFLGAVTWMVAVYILAREFGLQTMQYALCVSVCIAATLTVNGIYQSVVMDVLRPASTFNNPNLFGNYLLFQISIGLYLIFSDIINPNRLIQTLLSVAVIIISVGLFITGSRGSVIGFVALICVSIILLAYRGRISLRSILIIVFGCMLLPIAVTIFNPDAVRRLMSSQNIEVRLTMWETAMDLFLANPILGIGFGQLSEAFSEEIGKGINPHNLYVLITTETGIIGAIVFFGFIAIIARDSIKQSRRSLSVVFLAAGFGGMLAQGLVTDIENFRSVWIIIGFIAAHQAANESRPEYSFTTPIRIIRNQVAEIYNQCLESIDI